MAGDEKSCPDPDLECASSLQHCKSEYDLQNITLRLFVRLFLRFFVYFVFLVFSSILADCGALLWLAFAIIHGLTFPELCFQNMKYWINLLLFVCRFVIPWRTRFQPDEHHPCLSCVKTLLFSESDGVYLWVSHKHIVRYISRLNALYWSVLWHRHRVPVVSFRKCNKTLQKPYSYTYGEDHCFFHKPTKTGVLEGPYS